MIYKAPWVILAYPAAGGTSGHHFKLETQAEHEQSNPKLHGGGSQGETKKMSEKVLHPSMCWCYWDSDPEEGEERAGVRKHYGSSLGCSRKELSPQEGGRADSEAGTPPS